MESEVGIFHLELEPMIILNDNFSLSKFDLDPSSESETEANLSNLVELNILDDIKKVISKKKQLIIKFGTEYLHFYINYIIKKYPIYFEILKPISECITHKDQYELSFYFNNNIIALEIINDGIIENYFDDVMSLSSFYEFCLIVQDIVIFITID